jgi:thymidylate synthase (FAD)
MRRLLLMTDLQFRSDFTTDLVDQMGDDDSVLRAMLISTLKNDQVADMEHAAKRGRINFMMRSRHGSVFEHNSMTFRSEAPIFVYREWHRHRVGISINEASGRYTALPPVFYVPPPDRPLMQVGKPGAYEYVPGNAQLYDWLVWDMKNQACQQYASYQARLERGIAKEVARMSLGVNIYSSMYWTCNARSLMAFLSLRTRADDYWIKDESLGDTEPGPFYFQNPGGAMFPSKPMWEIEACARAMEQVFSMAFPLTYEAFVKHGRVAP